jgi:uncharacterized protein YbjT (DUF2867 family)
MTNANTITNNNETIVVTGATGTVGRQVVEALAKRPGITVRPAVRKDSFAKLPKSENVQPVAFDWDDDASYDHAVAGATRLFLLTPISDQQVAYGNKLVDAAKRAGVKHVVKLSVNGAELEPGLILGRLHRQVEQHIEASGLAYTLLRPNCFSDNWLSYWRPDAEGNIYIPFGAGKVAYIDARDIGDAAAVVLSTPGYENQAVVLSGAEALDTTQVAEILAHVTGKTVRYIDVPPEAAGKGMTDSGAPGWMVEGFLDLFAAIKAGYLGNTDSDAAKVLGRAPRTFAQFAKDRAELLR